MMGQLMAIGRTMWGLKVPNLKETEASLSYVQCFLYLVSSSISVCSFHITWLDTFWKDLLYFQHFKLWYSRRGVNRIILVCHSSKRQSIWFSGRSFREFVLTGVRSRSQTLELFYVDLLSLYPEVELGPWLPWPYLRNS